MSGPGVDPEQIAAALAVHGLQLRGGLHLADRDEAPALASGASARTLLLVGHAGAAHWPHFRHWRDHDDDGAPHPLDRWTASVVGALADRFGLGAVYPFERPYHPFQQWAARAEALRQSPIGTLMHPRFGTWHAYRAALFSESEILIPVVRNENHPCDACASKACLSACPVAAHSMGGFAYGSCLSHIRSPAGKPCMTGGCLARNACPVGTDFRYPRDMQAFHQQAFARA